MASFLRIEVRPSLIQSVKSKEAIIQQINQTKSQLEVLNPNWKFIEKFELEDKV